jgi:hypothetical protein
LLAAGRFLQRRQSEPGREIAPGRKPFGRWHERSPTSRFAAVMVNGAFLRQ